MLNLGLEGLKVAPIKAAVEDVKVDYLDIMFGMIELDQAMEDLSACLKRSSDMTTAFENYESIANVISKNGVSQGLLALLSDEFKAVGIVLPELKADGSNSKEVAQIAVENIQSIVAGAYDFVVQLIKKIADMIVDLYKKFLGASVRHTKALEDYVKDVLVKKETIDIDAFSKVEMQAYSKEDFGKRLDACKTISVFLKATEKKELGNVAVAADPVAELGVSKEVADALTAIDYKIDDAKVSKEKSGELKKDTIINFGWDIDKLTSAVKDTVEELKKANELEKVSGTLEKSVKEFEAKAKELAAKKEGVTEDEAKKAQAAAQGTRKAVTVLGGIAVAFVDEINNLSVQLMAICSKVTMKKEEPKK